MENILEHRLLRISARKKTHTYRTNTLHGKYTRELALENFRQTFKGHFCLPDLQTKKTHTRKQNTLHGEYTGELTLENFRQTFKGHFSLPDLGPIGANGLANPRDFLYPVANFDPPEAGNKK
jgi:hypothetical protein